MRGSISKKEVERFAREQQEMERLQKERGNAPKSFQPKLKNAKKKPNYEVEGEKERGKMVVTLRGRGKVIFSKMDKFERWVGGRDVH